MDMKEKMQHYETAKKFFKALDQLDLYRQTFISFSNRMTKTMGHAKAALMDDGSVGEFQIKFSIPIFKRATEKQIHDTIAHEVCHIVAYHLYGEQGLGHSQNWKRLMENLRLTPERYHYVDTSGLRKKQVRYFAACACQEHKVSGKVRSNIKKGHRYSCVKCDSFLKLTGEKSK